MRRNLGGGRQGDNQRRGAADIRAILAADSAIPAAAQAMFDQMGADIDALGGGRLNGRPCV
jgi:hypothetical protein